MKLAILIHVHTNPDQVSRLVSRLRHDQVDIYINVDARVDLKSFEEKINNVYFIKKRVSVQWGRFSQVEQIFNSFSEISSQKDKYSHILFISGSDYPIQPIDHVLSFLDKNKEKSFIDFLHLGNDEWSVLMKQRYEYWYFLPKSDIRSNELVKKILVKLGFKRKYPFPAVFYGSCWFCLNLKSVDFLLNFVEKNTRTVNFFRNVGCADELLIQSILLNSSLKENMVNKIYRYVDWSSQGKSPKVLTTEDASKILDSEAWFARKLDLSVDSNLFDILDKKNQG